MQVTSKVQVASEELIAAAVGQGRNVEPDDVTIEGTQQLESAQDARDEAADLRRPAGVGEAATEKKIMEVDTASPPSVQPSHRHENDVTMEDPQVHAQAEDGVMLKAAAERYDDDISVADPANVATDA